MNLLYSYKNWDYSTSIYSDWTKVREWDGVAQFPENIDIKITNYCDLGCPFCHENSTTAGKHWDIDRLLPILKQLPKGVEFAIGWGNPLSHPELPKLLKELKSSWYIPNLTVNVAHFGQLTPEILQYIYGLGISYGNGIPESITPDTYEHIVIHTIAGVHSTGQIHSLLERWFKVLILWYKNYWRGKTYLSDKIRDSINDLRTHIWELLTEGFLSFDNLALEQLNVRRFFTPQTRAERYMWDEGTFTMYLDASTEDIQYGIASSLPQRWKLENIFLAFNHVKDERKTICIWDE